MGHIFKIIILIKFLDLDPLKFILGFLYLVLIYMQLDLKIFFNPFEDFTSSFYCEYLSADLDWNVFYFFRFSFVQRLCLHLAQQSSIFSSLAIENCILWVPKSAESRCGEKFFFAIFLQFDFFSFRDFCLGKTYFLQKRFFFKRISGSFFFLSPEMKERFWLIQFPKKGDKIENFYFKTFLRILFFIFLEKFPIKMFGDRSLFILCEISLQNNFSVRSRAFMAQYFGVIELEWKIFKFHGLSLFGFLSTSDFFWEKKTSNSIWNSGKNIDNPISKNCFDNFI